jgi:fatty acid desaturase
MTQVRLLLFPALQLTLFILSIQLLQERPVLAALALLASSFAMSLTLHITIHEQVHQTLFFKQLNPLIHGVASVFIGAPFAGYKWHHWNHHRHNNGPCDYSSTWTESPDGLTPKGRISYSLGWPMTLARAQKSMGKEIALGEVPDEILKEISWQKILTPAFILALWLFGAPVLAIAYMTHIYFGWVLISSHNYSQHPPVSGHVSLSTSFKSRAFNQLFFNNGLHFEHHSAPGIPHNQLCALKEAPTVRLPHFAAAKVYFSRQVES